MSCESHPRPAAKRRPNGSPSSSSENRESRSGICLTFYPAYVTIDGAYPLQGRPSFRGCPRTGARGCGAGRACFDTAVRSYPGSSIMPCRMLRGEGQARGGGRSAMTLLELLVTVAIVFVLLGIILPAVHSVRITATDTQIRAEIH